MTSVGMKKRMHEVAQRSVGIDDSCGFWIGMIRCEFELLESECFVVDQRPIIINALMFFVLMDSFHVGDDDFLGCLFGM